MGLDAQRVAGRCIGQAELRPRWTCPRLHAATLTEEGGLAVLAQSASAALWKCTDPPATPISWTKASGSASGQSQPSATTSERKWPPDGPRARLNGKSLLCRGPLCAEELRQLPTQRTSLDCGWRGRKASVSRLAARTCCAAMARASGSPPPTGATRSATTASAATTTPSAAAAPFAFEDVEQPRLAFSRCCRRPRLRPRPSATYRRSRAGAPATEHGTALSPATSAASTDGAA